MDDRSHTEALRCFTGMAGGFPFPLYNGHPGFSQRTVVYDARRIVPGQPDPTGIHNSSARNCGVASAGLLCFPNL